MGPPRPHLETAPTALKKLDRVDTPTFSTKSATSRHSAIYKACSEDRQLLYFASAASQARPRRIDRTK